MIRMKCIIISTPITPVHARLIDGLVDMLLELYSDPAEENDLKEIVCEKAEHH
jgi:hypothetical protein